MLGEIRFSLTILPAAAVHLTAADFIVRYNNIDL